MQTTTGAAGDYTVAPTEPGPPDVERDPLAFAAKLHAALSARGQVIARGPLTPTERAELTRYRETLRAIGHHFEGDHHAVAVDPAPTAIALPPAHRAAIVVPRDAHQLIDPARVVAIGSDAPHPVIARFPRARTSPLGRMQKPPLDGPVPGLGHVAAVDQVLYGIGSASDLLATDIDLGAARALAMDEPLAP